MARDTRSHSIKATASQNAEDPTWGIPESPEFSAVQHLMNEFKTHEHDEAKWLKAYQEIADKAEDPLVRFLLSLIVADEERHHQIIDRMISRLKNDLAWTRCEEGARKRRVSAGAKAGLRASLEHFLAVERNGIKDYERLSRTSGGLGHDLFGVLCRTMIHDSEKHIGILEFLQRRARQRRKPARKSLT